MSVAKKCVFDVDDRLFCKEAVLKATYLFIDDYYVTASISDEHKISITIEAKETQEIKDIDKRFCNELIAQMVRYNIANSNKVMKELILGRALYSTCVDMEEEQDISENPEVKCDYSIDDIAVSWFDIN